MSSPYVYVALTSPSIFACPRNTAVESGLMSTSNAGRTYRSNVNDPDPETVPSPSPSAALASTVYFPSGGSKLVGILAAQLDVLGQDLDQLYVDQFIETCADWVVPYIGDLIGYRSLHQEVPAMASPRAEVAHTIALRRRKGTALVLEQLARDVTNWDARAVEYFQRLCTTQTAF